MISERLRAGRTDTIDTRCKSVRMLSQGSGVCCTLPRGHAGLHSSGQGVVWEDFHEKDIVRVIFNKSGWYGEEGTVTGFHGRNKTTVAVHFPTGQTVNFQHYELELAKSPSKKFYEVAREHTKKTLTPYVDQLSSVVDKWINTHVPASIPTMPYSRQWVLEKLIERLQEAV